MTTMTIVVTVITTMMLEVKQKEEKQQRGGIEHDEIEKEDMRGKEGERE